MTTVRFLARLRHVGPRLARGRNRAGKPRRSGDAGAVVSGWHVASGWHGMSAMQWARNGALGLQLFGATRLQATTQMGAQAAVPSAARGAVTHMPRWCPAAQPVCGDGHTSKQGASQHKSVRTASAQTPYAAPRRAALREHANGIAMA